MYIGAELTKLYEEHEMTKPIKGLLGCRDGDDLFAWLLAEERERAARHGLELRELDDGAFSLADPLSGIGPVEGTFDEVVEQLDSLLEELGGAE